MKPTRVVRSYLDSELCVTCTDCRSMTTSGVASRSEIILVPVVDKLTLEK